MAAIALKAGKSFSLYYYDATAANVASLDFITTGASLGPRGKAQTLSHATLYQPIPEPETYALMLAGLAAVGFVVGRRKSA